jgi:hypothetical protein
VGTDTGGGAAKAEPAHIAALKQIAKGARISPARQKRAALRSENG